MAEYHCFPLWWDGNEVGNIDPEQLPLTEDLKLRLRDWAATYDRTLNHDYPPDSSFVSPSAERKFEAEGQSLLKALQTQLSPKYEVVYKLIEKKVSGAGSKS